MATNLWQQIYGNKFMATNLLDYQIHFFFQHLM